MNYNSGNTLGRLTALLSQNVVRRCADLGVLFDNSNIRDLQEFFPTLVNSIFNITTNDIGWGLRTITQDIREYDILSDFFMPYGPMFRLCYRLLSVSIKFQFNLEYLPIHMREMLQMEEYPNFYMDLVNKDDERSRVTSLSLNAFDYFILCFAIHGTFPLHRYNPEAQRVHMEKQKTVYFLMAAQYMCVFLPGSVNQDCIPPVVCAAKSYQRLPRPHFQSKCSPQYMRSTAVSPYYIEEIMINKSANCESNHAYIWRTESVLHLFIDTWLRYDTPDGKDLPSSEYVLAVRILIKQLHFFHNVAHQDTTSMAVLRRISLPILKLHIYKFLRCLIWHWPSDSTVTAVIELWLTYIQPWRYESSEDKTKPVDVPVPSRYNNFIKDNLSVYTQIFVQMLPRLERLDFTVDSNVSILLRVVKVLSQTTLPRKILAFEKLLCNTFGNKSTAEVSNPFRRNAIRHNSSRSDIGYSDGAYIPLFGRKVAREADSLIRTLYNTKEYITLSISQTSEAPSGFWETWIGKFFRMTKDTFSTQPTHSEKRKVLDNLETVILSLGNLFDLDVSHSSYFDGSYQSDISANERYFSFPDDGDQCGHTRVGKVPDVLTELSNDPVMLPVQRYECGYLVHLMSKMSDMLNERFAEQIKLAWNKPGYLGRVSQKVLYPPMRIKWLEKVHDDSMVMEGLLPPRLSLRFLASYKMVVAIVFSLLAAKLIYGVSIIGPILFALFYLLYICAVAIF